MLRSFAHNLPIALLSAMMFLLAAVSLIVLGIGVDIAGATGIEPGNAGLLVTAFALPYAILAPLFQLLVGGRSPPGVIVIAGGVVMAVGLLLTGLANEPIVLFLGRALTAMGAALITPAALTMATMLAAPERRGRAIAAVYLGFTLASVIGVPLGTQLAQWLGWRSTFFAFAALSLALSVLGRAVLPALAPTGALSLKAALGIVRDRRVLCVFGAAAAQLAAQFMVLAPMAPLLLHHFGLSLSLLPAVLLAFGIAGVVGNHFGGIWSDGISLGRTLAISLVGLTATLIAFSLPLGGYVAAIVFVFFAFFGTLFRSPQIVLLTRSVDDDLRALAIGLNTSAAYAGLTIGSAASAAVISGSGYHALGWSALAFVAVAVLLLGIVVRQRAA